VPARVGERRGGSARRPGVGVTSAEGVPAAGGVTSAGGVRAAGVVGVAPRCVRVGEFQRGRLLAAAVAAVDELGYVGTTVGDIASRARVSRRTFYELFANREECLAAVLEDVVALIGEELVGLGLGGLGWCERVRGGLSGILGFLDREPALARVCVVQVLRGGAGVLERREELLAGLAAVVDEGRLEGTRGAGCTPLTAEGVVGAAFSIVYARLLRGERRPLSDLTSELTGMIVLPYLGVAAARREQARPVPVGPQNASGGGVLVARAAADPLQGVAMRLTYRTARVLECIAELGQGTGSGPSNRMVADQAGVADPGQISKLLRRLERLGLLVNASGGHQSGEPNAWELTPLGEQVAQRLSVSAGDRSAAA
jgi:AcrR family transcriptional regulator